MDQSSPKTQEDELALLIQDGQASDRLLSEVLVRNYAARVYRLALAVLDGSPNVEGLAREVTKTTFTQALDDPDSIRGYDDISSWLYAIAIRTLQAHYRHFLRGQVFLRSPFSPPEAMARNFLRQTVHALSPKHRLPVILRYGFNLSLERIATILALPEEKIHSRLNLARRKISACFDPPLYLPTHRKAHREQSRLLAALDGLTPPEEIIDLKAHLADCPDCQAFGEAIHQLEDRLSHILQTWWPPPTLDEHKIQEIITATDIEPPNNWKSNLAGIPAKEIAWIGVVTILFFAIIRFANPFQTQLKPPDIPTPTPYPTLPPPVVLPTLETPFLDPDLTASSGFPPGRSPGNPIWKLDKRIKSGEGPVTSLAFSPDGRLLAAGFGDQVIRVWGYPNEAGLTDLSSPGGQITSLAFSPDSRLLASGSTQGQVIIWNTWNGKVLFILEDHPGPVVSLAFSPDGKFLAVGTPRVIWVWEVNATAFVRVWQYPGEAIADIAFPPDGEQLAIADGKSIVIRSFPVGDLLIRFQVQKDTIRRIRFSPEGGWLASASADGTVALTRFTEEPPGEYRFEQGFSLVHTSPVIDLAFTPDGEGLATVTEKGKLLFWDTSTRRLSYPHTVESLQSAPFQHTLFSPDGSSFVSSVPDGTIFLWGLTDPASGVASPPPSLYFRREPDNQAAIRLVIPDLLSKSKNDFPLTFTEAKLVAPGDLSPLRDLPSAFIFRGARFDRESQTVTLHYQFEPWKYPEETPEVFLRVWLASQTSPGLKARPLRDLLEMDSIGASAFVELIPLASENAELVEGRWVLTPQDNPSLEDLPPGTHDLIARWLPEGILRLRWQKLGYRLEIATVQIQLETGKKIPGQKEILQLANEINQRFEAKNWFPYAIQPGDTCTGIANRFGTTVGTLAKINKIADCDLIFAGDTLMIPLPRLREVVTETDLDCNGTPERVLTIRDPADPDGPTNFGITVEGTAPVTAYPAPQPEYWTVWQYSLADIQNVRFESPILFSVGGCEKFIALAIRDVLNSNDRLKIFRWNGLRMDTVLDVPGETNDLSSQLQKAGTPFTIAINAYVESPGIPSCPAILIHYTWNGERFERVEAESPPLTYCGGGYP